MKILVTGGAGFIGSHLVDALIEKGHSVAVADNLSTGKKENLNPKAKFYQLDILSPDLRAVFEKEKPEAVFHLAAQIDLRQSVEDPVEDAKINILGSLNVFENCREFGIQKIIFASTGGAIYGDTAQIPTDEDFSAFPLSPYGIAKLATESYLNYYYQVFGLAYVSLRLANVYGPRQDPFGEAGVVAIFCQQMLSGQQPVINGHGRQTRDYTFIDDVVQALIMALEQNKTGIFNVGTGIETSVNELFEKLKKAGNFDIAPIYGPAKKGEQQRSCLNYSKIREQLGWQPETSLDKGLKKTIDWFRTKIQKEWGS